MVDGSLVENLTLSVGLTGALFVAAGEVWRIARELAVEIREDPRPWNAVEWRNVVRMSPLLLSGLGAILLAVAATIAWLPA